MLRYFVNRGTDKQNLAGLFKKWLQNETSVRLCRWDVGGDCSDYEDA